MHKTGIHSIGNLHRKDYSCADVAVFLLVHRDRKRLEKDDSKMPASEIVKSGRDSEWLSWGLHFKNSILQYSPLSMERSFRATSNVPSTQGLIRVLAMLAHRSSNPSTRLEILYWFFLSIPTILLFPLALSLTGLLIPARATITTSTRGITSPNTIPRLRMRGGVSRR